MKRIWMRAAALALCAGLLALLVGCALRSAASGSADTEAAADPLTGLEALWPGQRPVAVVIENDSGSTTQWGIASASVVLEALTESDAAPSLCLVYPSASAVPKVGPVAAGQDLYWRLLIGQQVLPVQKGGGIYDRNFLDYYDLRAVDALEVGKNAFSCAEEWSNAPAWYTSGDALSGVLESLGLSAELNVPAAPAAVTSAAESAAGASSGAQAEQPVPEVPALLPFSASAKLPTPSAEDASLVLVRFEGQSTTGFRYDAGAGVYKMLRGGISPQRDADSGEQAAFDNLLILYSAASLRDDGRTLDYDLSMGGGVWLNGGRLWEITWTQGSETTLLFYDADGELLSLTPGRSYIALVESLTGEELSVSNSAGEVLEPAAQAAAAAEEAQP